MTTKATGEALEGRQNGVEASASPPTANEGAQAGPSAAEGLTARIAARQQAYGVSLANLREERETLNRRLADVEEQIMLIRGALAALGDLLQENNNQ